MPYKMERKSKTSVQPDSDKEFAFLMINPWAMNFARSIIQEFDNVGERLRLASVPQIPLDTIAAHYRPHSQQSFYIPLISDLVGRSALIAIYHGNMKELKVTKRTIRERYSSQIQPSQTHRRDAVHMSMTRDEFNREVSLWIRHFKNFRISYRDICGYSNG